MDTDAKQVIVYSTPTCPYCVRAKAFLKEKNVAFEDVDVAADRARAMEMIQKTGQMGVPVIDIGGEIVIGFQPAAMSELLGLPA